MAPLIKRLSSESVSSVKINGKTVSMFFLRKKIAYRFKLIHEKNVADWNRHKNIIYVSRYVEKQDLLPVLVHECVEKYVSKKYGFDVDREAHRVATAVERRFVLSRKRNWRRHEQKISVTWRRENKRKIGRTRFF
ncbi:MAG: hypothetical protein HYT72_02140 [Candidatus Aenigmarchaeota archaeon]|nr:hypothetical protein [Candidatus Aenigmarchaeota archaeon]